MSYTAWSVVYGEQPTAAKWNQLGSNDAGFRDGTNLDDSIIDSRHYVDASIDHEHVNFSALLDATVDNNNTSGNTTTTYMDVCSVTITPKSTASRIVLMAALATYCDNTAGGRSGKVRFLRNGAVLGTDPIDAAIGAIDGTTNVNARTPILYIDSPASVSAQTYKIQVAANGAYLFYKNNSSRFSTLIALELKQ